MTEEQEKHNEDRFQQALAMIANLQAQSWAAGRLLAALLESGDVPDGVKTTLRTYPSLVEDSRRHIAIDQYPKPQKLARFGEK
jgi:hypothetical protein